MGQYVRISSQTGGSCNSGLKQAIIFIGKHYSGQTNKKNEYTSKEYYKKGIKYISKRYGSFRMIRTMVESRKVDDNTREWWYHKRVYEKAYRFIVLRLFRCKHDDKKYVAKLLNDLYVDIRNNIGADNELTVLCSNILVFWQKSMLKLCNGSNRYSDVDREVAGEILTKIDKTDDLYKKELCKTVREDN